MNKSSTNLGVLSQRPELRWPLDVQYLEASGERYVMFRDPAGIAPEPLIIPWGLLAVVSRFDGQRSLQDILHEGAPHGLTQALLETTLSDLDELLFLEGERVDSVRKQIADEFRSTPFRPMN